MSDKYLSELMDNVLAYRLGLIARDAGTRGPDTAGDEIDRGLILRRLLEEKQFHLVYVGPKPV